MRYNTSTVLDAGVGLIADYTMRGNSVFDPDFSGIGGQPVGFDQIATFYDHYTVIGAVLRCTFLNNDTGDPQTVGITVNDSGIILTDRQLVLSNPNCRFTTLGGKGSSRDTVTMVYKLNPNKFLGIGNPLSNPETRAQVSLNPTEQCFFHIFAGAIDPTVNAVTVSVNITLDYTVVFTEPKKVALS